MKPPPRDGVWTANGLSADFRFVRTHLGDLRMSWIETVAGEFCAPDDQLAWDPAQNQESKEKP